MSVSIITKDYVKTKKILIDEMEWDFIAPGAGLTLDLSRLAREVSKKEATPEEQAELVETMFEYYESIFKDSTKDNSQVKKWLRETPIETIGLIVAEVQKQSE